SDQKMDKGGDVGAHLLGAGLLIGFAALVHLLIGRRDERLLLLVVDDLGVDVLGAAENGQTRPLGRALDALARRTVPLLAGFPLVLDVREHDLFSSSGMERGLAAATRRRGLAGLLLDCLLDVLDALALVRLGRAQLADLGG